MNQPASGKRKKGSPSGARHLAATCVLVLIWCPLLSGQAPARAVQPSATKPGSALPAAPLGAIPDYVISLDDVLSVNVYDAPDITGEYRVSPTGHIDLPLLSKPIMAAGFTPTQLADQIGAQYRQAGIITHPRITVAVKESRVHSITVAGAVKMPQIYPLFGRTTLLDILSQAQGLADDASNTAIVARGKIARAALAHSGACEADPQPAYCESTFSVDLKRLLETGDPSANVDLYPGDRVTVQHAGIVYVEGAVNKPGGYALKAGQEDMTVLRALALAEDLKPTASRKNIIIIRKDPAEKNGRKEIPVNLKDIYAGRGADPPLHANDILYVADSTAGRAWRRGAEAAITAATWGVVYRMP